MKQHGIDKVELGIHDAADDSLLAHLKGKVRQDGDATILCNTSGDITIFSCFRFPILHLTKREMAKMAKQNGFFELMKLSWFCHTPDPQLRPCGICYPCHLAIEEGMGWRLPLRKRVRHRLYALTN